MTCTLRILHAPGEPDMPAFMPGTDIACWRGAQAPMLAVARGNAITKSVEAGFFAPTTEFKLGGADFHRDQCTHTITYEPTAPGLPTVASVPGSCSASAAIAAAVLVTWWRLFPESLQP